MSLEISNKRKILLIDDDKSVTKMLSMLLETRGYNVNIANSGDEGLNVVSTTTDLILLDLVLPDVEGFEVCRRLKESDATRHIPIIILSAKVLSGDIVEGLYLGADDYLTKPFEYEELVARMEAVMRRGSLFNKDNTDGDEAIVQEIRKIIEEERVVSFFQPIFQMKPFKILGLEALTRPKTQSMLSNPELLFKAAVQFGFYQDLEILSWKKAVENASKFITDEKIFLNCNPYLVEGPKFLTIKSLFDKSVIKTDNVVLEITERSAITDFKIFYDNLARYREYGFKFAIDDVGGGFASLEAIVETRPEVVKIDYHITNNVDKDPIKKSIVKFVVNFCKENGIISIAEGVETKEELATVMGLGIDAVQGYYLFRPTSQVDIDEMNSVENLVAEHQYLT